MNGWTLAQVAVGGAVGASARYAAGVAVMRIFGPGFPLGTLLVNVAGSFLMGVLVVVLAHLGGARFAPLLAVGILGGFTTFSSFALDAVTLYERGATGQAAGYVLASVTLSLGGIVAGLAVARSVLA